MLDVREVTKSYSGRAVVNRVSFSMQPSEILALLGPNGAGKTTLIRMITDILRPDEGTILLEGKPAADADRRHIAYLPEERGLYRRAPVAEVVSYYGTLKGLSAREARAEAQALLERMELGEWARKQVQALSKGMQQKVQFCTVLIGRPRLLILDEPFAGLDPLNTQLFEELLAERRRNGATVLLSTHQMGKVEELCDRALMINHGRMVLYGPVRDIRRSYSDDSVVVRCDVDLKEAPGVAHVEGANGEQHVRFGDGGSPKRLLAYLAARGAEVEHFALASMPLEDIFVKVVREGVGLDRGESSREPAPAGARAVEAKR
jgi:ABC-2 type transport system ATP-binding protein